jgi:hypothetical protein
MDRVMDLIEGVLTATAIAKKIVGCLDLADDVVEREEPVREPNARKVPLQRSIGRLFACR